MHYNILYPPVWRCSILHKLLANNKGPTRVPSRVPARLVLKPNLPTFRFGQSDTPYGFQKEEASYCDLPSLLPLGKDLFLSLQRPATPHPGNGHPAPPHARIRGLSGSFVVLPVLEENTVTVGLGTAST